MTSPLDLDNAITRQTHQKDDFESQLAEIRIQAHDQGIMDIYDSDMPPILDHIKRQFMREID